jgi:HlyD family secretion protein
MRVRKHPSSLLAGACLAALALAASCAPASPEGAKPADAQATAAAPSIATIRVAPIALRPMQGVLVASGELTVRDEIVIASDLEGQKIARLLVDEGDWVSAGQPIAILDDTLLSAQARTQAASLRRAEAALAAGEARAAQAAREKDRVTGLAAEGVVADELIEQRDLAARLGVQDAAAAAADVAFARAQIGETATRRARLTLRAPASGRVLARSARVGDVVGAGTGPLFRIARGGLIELSAEAPERDLALLEPGAPAQVTLPNGTTLAGSVRLISPLVDPQTRMGAVRITLPPSPQLRPGGFAEASFTLPATPRPAVPDRAIVQGPQGSAVLVVGRGDIVRSVPVKVVQRANGWSGLEAGEALVGQRVVLSGDAFASAGDRVTPSEERAS